MDKLLTCLYNQYFLVEQYKNDVQILEGKYHINISYLQYYIIYFFTNMTSIVYNLAEMKLETTTKRVEERDRHTRKYNKNTFSINKQKSQLCFTRGLQTVK